MTTVHRLPTRAVKLTIPVPIGDFPVGAIPPPGTPGGKGILIEVEVVTQEGTSLRATLKGGAMQRLLPQIAAAPQPGGFIVVQGKLGPGGTIDEAGCTFQPGKVEQPLQDPGQMPEHRGP